MHGLPVDQVHFHEVGEADAIADIVGACLLMSWLAPQQVLASRTCGQRQGALRARHRPGAGAGDRATAPRHPGIRRDDPRRTVYAYRRRPAQTLRGRIRPRAAGDDCDGGRMRHGFRDFEAANCVRALLGELAETGSGDDVIELSCNLDDMTGEAIGYAQQQIFAHAARSRSSPPR